MTDSSRSSSHTIARIYRYPVKSMQGEPLTRAHLSARGIEGDRRWAVISRETGRVVSAKHPRKWGRILSLAARGQETSILFPDGRELSAGDPDTDDALSSYLGRAVRLSETPPEEPTIERVDPTKNGEPVENPEMREERTSVLARGAPAGTFFDYAPLHVVTTATLRYLQERWPGSSFDVRRFRPNLLLDLPETEPFSENGWNGTVMRLGDGIIRLGLPSPRCAVPTVAQPGLPEDQDIIRAIARYNRIHTSDTGYAAYVGAYAEIVRPGAISQGDRVTLGPCLPARRR